jgi:hypothetical protein
VDRAQQLRLRLLARPPPVLLRPLHARTASAPRPRAPTRKYAREGEGGRPSLRACFSQI